MYSEENRPLKYAIAASIVLHGMLLFGVSQRDRARPGESQIPSILARLVELPAPIRDAEPPRRSAPVKPPTQIKPASPKRLARPAPAPTVEPAEPIIEPAEAPRTEAQTQPGPELAAPQEDRPGNPVGAEAAMSSAPAAAPAEDPGSLDKYRLQLKLVAAKYKRYPRMATDNNWKGVVALRMVVGPSGQVASFIVTKTSGHEVLDRQAQEMFRSAAADVPVPPVLRGKQFAVDVAVDYYFTD
jgi:periplasmic protein TonB